MKTTTLFTAAAALLMASTPGFAASKALATEGDWTVFSASSPKECWAVSAPKSTVNTKNGKQVEVKRDAIRLYVTYRPGAGGPEVSFAGGYPFAPDSTVEINIGGNVFKLFTEGETAWTGSPSEDGKLLSALRAGSTAVITGRSSRGTVTKDTFSLSGITAASKKADAACK